MNAKKRESIKIGLKFVMIRVHSRLNPICVYLQKSAANFLSQTHTDNACIPTGSSIRA